MAISDAAHAIIDHAAVQIEGRTKDYKIAQDFYDGNHPPPPATDRWTTDLQREFEGIRDNLCPLVVDGIVSRLKVSGFAPETRHIDPDDPKLFDYPDGKPEALPRPGTWREPSGEDRQAEMERRRADDLWSYNRMDGKQREVHREAATKGDAFVIVWEDPDGRACIEPNDPELCHIEWDPEMPTRKLWAVKRWQQANRVRVNIYYGPRAQGGARIEKYVSVYPAKDVKAKTGSAEWEPYQPTRLEQELADDGETPTGNLIEVPAEPWPLPNPYDDVPMFHFRNQGKTGRYGRSELEAVAPIQLALNKEVVSLLLTSEQYGIPVRAITGLRPELDTDTGKPKPIDFKPLVDNILAVWGEGVNLAQFAAAELAQHIGVINDLRSEMGRLSQTPPYMMFMVTGEQPSGEMLRVADAPFNAKIEDRQTIWGNTWEDALAFAMRVDTHNGTIVRYSIEWEDTQPKSQLEVAQTGQAWLALGVPHRIIWKRLLGATDRECDEWWELRLQERAAEPIPPVAGTPDAQGTIPGQPPNEPPSGVTPPQLAPYAAGTRAMVGATAGAPRAPRERPRRRR
jgi:hypothetical protein